METELTTEDLSKYTKEYLQKFNVKEDEIVTTNNANAKIINNFVCYIAFILNSDEAQNAEVGDNVTITYPSGNTEKAEVAQINKESDEQSVILFSVNNKIEDLNLYRKANFTITWWNSKGLKIPSNAIEEENGLSYIYSRKSSNSQFKKTLIKVKKSADNYSIITNYSTAELKELQFDNNVNTSISLYDEVKLGTNTD